MKKADLATQCSLLLEKFGTQIKSSHCKQLSGEVADMLAGLFEERDTRLKP